MTVKNWQVSFYSGNKLLRREFVATISKRLAHWLANEQSGFIALDPDFKCNRVAVSVVRKK
jgi:hypothetical protein